MTDQNIRLERGRVLAIFIAPAAGEQMVSVEEVTALAGRGLAGDRYCASTGTWSTRTQRGPRDLTLIAREGLEALSAEGVPLTPAESRRNILTEGIDLARLVGKQFRVGQAVCQAIRLAQPCSYLEAKTRPGVLKGLVDRGGIFAAVLTGGRIAVGDVIEEIPPSKQPA